MLAKRQIWHILAGDGPQARIQLQRTSLREVNELRGESVAIRKCSSFLDLKFASKTHMLSKVAILDTIMEVLHLTTKYNTSSVRIRVTMWQFQA